ncbi:MAG: Trk system potassium transporter TrkA [Firmicutes bacterium]|nr:Trk system potassium transporter TrkA [Bacillota bacterium]
MRIMIIGAGKLGMKVAASLVSPDNYITLIDINPKVIQKASNEMDVLAIAADALEADIYDDLNIRQYDYVLALMDNDEKNLVVSCVVKKLGCKKVVARLRGPEYMNHQELMKDTFNIDQVLNPDMLVSHEIFNYLINQHKDFNQFFTGPTIGMLEVRAETIKGMVGDRVLNASNYLENMLIVSISRKGKLIIPKSHVTIEENDVLYLLGKKTDIAKISPFIDTKVEGTNIKKVMIMGGGKTGFYLGKLLSDAGISVKIIEKDLERCEYLAEKLSNVLVLHGDATDMSLLQEENLASMDAFVSATGYDEDNIILALTAQQYGVKEVLAKTSRGNYSLLMDKVGVNTLNTLEITTSYILRLVQSRSFVSSSFFLQGQAEVLEVIAQPDMMITGKMLKELDFPKGVLVSLIYRNNTTIVPTGNTRIQPNDRLIFFSMLSDVPELERMLRATKKKLFRV